MSAEVLNNPYKVLIIENSLADRTTIKTYLNADRNLTYQFEETEFGEKGLELCHSWHPDFILLNYWNPDITAVEFLEALLRQEKELPCPVIIFTGQGNATLATTCMKYGAQDYLLKSTITPESLQHSLQSSLQSYQRKIHERYALQTTILESISDAFYAVDSNERIVYVNQKTEELWSMRREDLLGKKIQEVFPNLEELPVYSYFRHALTTQTPFEFETYSDYIRRWIKAKIYPTGDGISIYLQDISVHKQAEEQMIQWNNVLAKQVAERTAILTAEIEERKQIEKSLKESEALNHSVLDALSEGVILHDLDGTILSANVGAERILGIPVTKLIGRTSFDSSWQAIHQDGTPFPKESYPAMLTLQSGTACRGVIMGIKWPDETIKWLSLNTQPLFHVDGTTLRGVVASFTDITESLAADEALKKSEENYRLLTENSLDMVFKNSSDGKTLYISPACRTLLGYEPEELLGQSAFANFHPDDFGVIQNAIKMGRSNAGKIRVEYRYRRKDGSYIWLEAYSQGVYDPETGAPLFSTGTSRDITARKQAEEALKESEERYHSLYDNSLSGVLLGRLDGSILAANPAACQMLGYEEQELIALGRNGIVSENAPQLKLDQQQVRQFKRLQRETVFIRKNGTSLLCEHSSSLYQNKDGQEQLCIVIKDITVQKQAENILKRYQLLSENTLEIILFINTDGNILEANKAASLAYGYTIEELQSLNIRDLKALTTLGEVTPQLQDSFKIFETLHRRKDGSVFSVEVSSHSAELEGERILISVIRDITKRKEITDQLRRSEESYRFLADGSTDMISKLSPERVFEYVSPICQTIVGFTPEELIGHSLLEYVHPDDQAYMKKVQTSWQENGNESFITYRTLCKNGQYLWLEASVHYITDPVTGQLVSIIAIGRNLTERRKKEEAFLAQEKLQVALQKEQELSEMKTKMMRRISHEFRTPLSIVLTASETLVYYLDRLTPEKRKYYTELIPRTIQDITSMLDDIAFMVKDKITSEDFTFSVVSLETICKRVVSKLEPGTAHSHTIILDTGEFLDFLLADERLLSYALHNLLLNAIKYSPQGSKIWINLSTQNGELVLEVKDEGIGISEKDQERIFEPFYRGSNINEVGGIGVGLSIVKRVVDLHRGSISVVSELNKGTTFIVRLPFAR